MVHYLFISSLLLKNTKGMPSETQKDHTIHLLNLELFEGRSLGFLLLGTLGEIFILTRGRSQFALEVFLHL